MIYAMHIILLVWRRKENIKFKHLCVFFSWAETYDAVWRKKYQSLDTTASILFSTSSMKFIQAVNVSYTAYHFALLVSK